MIDLSINTNPLPLKRLLDGSLYYPASGLDADPVTHFSDRFQSFVYVDYAMAGEAELIADIDNGPFPGFTLIGRRSVARTELRPNGRRSMVSMRKCDGNPNKYRYAIKPEFAVWAIFEAADAIDDNGRPRRISLLYVCGDGAVTYQDLYAGAGATPAAIAIIQPGLGYGFNDTDYEDPAQILHRSIAANPGGLPQTLLYGGIGKADFYRQTCWSDFSQMRNLVETMPGERWVSVWDRPEPR